MLADYRLRSVRQTDAELIRGWRNSQLPILRQRDPISYGDQQSYFARYVMADQRSTEPLQILLMFLKGGSIVGYGGLTHIAWLERRAELSYLTGLSTSSNYSENFQAFLRLLHYLAFEHLGLRRIWHETYGRCPDHVKTLENTGYELEGRLRDHVLVQGEREDSLIYGLIHEDD